MNRNQSTYLGNIIWEQRIELLMCEITHTSPPSSIVTSPHLRHIQQTTCLTSDYKWYTLFLNITSQLQLVCVLPDNIQVLVAPNYYTTEVARWCSGYDVGLLTFASLVRVPVTATLGYFWDRSPGKLSWNITITQVNSALHPSGVAKSSTSFGWGKAGKSPRPGGR